MKELIKEKDNEIQTLKKKLKIPNTQHVQTPKLVTLQEERDKIYKEMLMYKEQVAQLKEDNSNLEKEKVELLVLKAYVSAQNQECSLENLAKTIS